MSFNRRAGAFGSADALAHTAGGVALWLAGGIVDRFRGALEQLDYNRISASYGAAGDDDGAGGLWIPFRLAGGKVEVESIFSYQRRHISGSYDISQRGSLDARIPRQFQRILTRGDASGAGRGGGADNYYTYNSKSSFKQIRGAFMKRAIIEYNSPSPVGGSYKEIEKLGELVADKFGYKPGDDLYPILEKLGGRYHYINSWEFYDNESVFVHGPEDFDIYLSNYTSPLRDRFTIVHEFSHYILHSIFGEIPIVAKRNGSDRVEKEANWFAAGFLMPEKKIREMNKTKNSILDIAAKLQVSVRAVEVRLSVLGIKYG